MGILGAVLVFIVNRPGGKILGAKTALDVVPTVFQSGIGHPHGVRTHIGNQAGGTAGAQFHPFIKLLGHHHRFLGAEIELAGSLLLQLAGNKRR